MKKRRLSSEHPYYGIFCCVLSGLFFGLIGYFGLSATRQSISVYNMLAWRFLVGIVFLMLVAKLLRRPLHFRPKGDAKSVISYGVFLYGPCAILYFLAAQMIGSGLAMVIFYCYPAFVMLINIMTGRQTFSVIYGVSVACISIGMCFLANIQQSELSLLGIAYSIASAALYSFYIVFSKDNKVLARESTILLCLGCMLTAFVSACYDSSFFFPQNWSVWQDILGIGIFCTALPMMFLIEGLGYINATQASILSVFEPIFVVIFGVLLLGESITGYQGIGIIIVLAASLFSLLEEREG